jgi:hypothetical protein
MGKEYLSEKIQCWRRLQKDLKVSCGGLQVDAYIWENFKKMKDSTFSMGLPHPKAGPTLLSLGVLAPFCLSGLQRLSAQLLTTDLRPSKVPGAD